MSTDSSVSVPTPPSAPEPAPEPAHEPALEHVSEPAPPPKSIIDAVNNPLLRADIDPKNTDTLPPKIPLSPHAVLALNLLHNTAIGGATAQAWDHHMPPCVIPRGPLITTIMMGDPNNELHKQRIRKKTTPEEQAQIATVFGKWTAQEHKAAASNDVMCMLQLILALANTRGKVRILKKFWRKRVVINELCGAVETGKAATADSATANTAEKPANRTNPNADDYQLPVNAVVSHLEAEYAKPSAPTTHEPTDAPESETGNSKKNAKKRAKKEKIARRKNKWVERFARDIFKPLAVVQDSFAHAAARSQQLLVETLLFPEPRTSDSDEAKVLFDYVDPTEFPTSLDDRDKRCVRRCLLSEYIWSFLGYNYLITMIRVLEMWIYFKFDLPGFNSPEYQAELSDWEPDSYVPLSKLYPSSSLDTERDTPVVFPKCPVYTEKTRYLTSRHPVDLAALNDSNASQLYTHNHTNQMLYTRLQKNVFDNQILPRLPEGLRQMYSQLEDEENLKKFRQWNEDHRKLQAELQAEADDPSRKTSKTIREKKKSKARRLAAANATKAVPTTSAEPADVAATVAESTTDSKTTASESTTVRFADGTVVEDDDTDEDIATADDDAKTDTKTEDKADTKVAEKIADKLIPPRTWCGVGYWLASMATSFDTKSSIRPGGQSLHAILVMISVIVNTMLLPDTHEQPPSDAEDAAVAVAVDADSTAHLPQPEAVPS